MTRVSIPTKLDQIPCSGEGTARVLGSSAGKESQVKIRLLTNQNDNFGACRDNTRGRVTDNSSGFTTFVYTGSKYSSRNGFRFE
uniref:Uncharacterized protein n=1 Tax=Helianthus annuus TaxID=4232 RepID=A0A251UZW6_HELAN